MTLLWLIYQLTHSSLILGIMGFASGLSAAIITPWAGAFSDRTDPRRLTILISLLYCCLATTLAAHFYFQAVALWSVVFLMVLFGCLGGIYRPVHQMYIPRLLQKKEDLTSAIASSSIVYDIARMIGPIAGGWLLSHFTGMSVFVFCGIAYAAAALSFFVIPKLTRSHQALEPDIFQTLLAGIRRAISIKKIRGILLLSGCLSFAANGYMIILPVLAERVFQGSVQEYGHMMSSVGLGAITGALFLGLSSKYIEYGYWICGGGGLFSIGLIALSFSPTIEFAFLALFLLGFGITVMMTSCNSLLISTTATEEHGRIMSLFTLSYLGMAPLGSLTAGLLADNIGASPTVLLNGLIACFSLLLFSRMIVADIPTKK